MSSAYRHKEIEKKWREYWEEHPVNVNDGKKPNTTASICSHIRREADSM